MNIVYILLSSAYSDLKGARGAKYNKSNGRHQHGEQGSKMLIIMIVMNYTKNGIMFSN